jgi:hypothetical protein
LYYAFFEDRLAHILLQALQTSKVFANLPWKKYINKSFLAAAGT